MCSNDLSTMDYKKTVVLLESLRDIAPLHYKLYGGEEIHDKLTEIITTGQPT